MLGTDIFQLAYHLPALTSYECGSTCIDKSAGNVDSGAFRAPRVQVGDHLQYGWGGGQGHQQSSGRSFK